MILHNGLFIGISIIFAIIEGGNVSSYSSKGLKLFKFIFSIVLGLLLSFILLVSNEQAFLEYSELYRLFILFPCAYITFVGIEMIIYGMMGSKEYR